MTGFEITISIILMLMLCRHEASAGACVDRSSGSVARYTNDFPSHEHFPHRVITDGHSDVVGPLDNRYSQEQPLQYIPDGQSLGQPSTSASEPQNPSENFEEVLANLRKEIWRHGNALFKENPAVGIKKKQHAYLTRELEPIVSKAVPSISIEEFRKIPAAIEVVMKSRYEYKKEHHMPTILFQKNCIICLYYFVDGDTTRVLPCGHQYHVKCIDRWLEEEEKCPCCLMSVWTDKDA
ncbi:hypothetical protein SeMB42_g05443 [Synchytrium endobioticum]|uniref:RING-type domain-containing protein n=1 Tax=Synchytrium endobioticum TaxID=286115 RepID=A0A507CRM5_9FUNG|nr:hypothetical protein SeMB42_g05443 [Synchytrium endobioticum]